MSEQIDRLALTEMIEGLRAIDKFIACHRNNGLADNEIITLPKFQFLSESAQTAEEKWCGIRPDQEVYLKIGSTLIDDPDINYT